MRPRTEVTPQGDLRTRTHVGQMLRIRAWSPGRRRGRRGGRSSPTRCRTRPRSSRSPITLVRPASKIADAGCVTTSLETIGSSVSVSYTHLRAHETDSYLVCRLLLEK